VESIIATTFTRKAAGEILDRVLRRLAEAALKPQAAAQLSESTGSAVSPDHAAAMLAALCRSLHRVSVCTIDSLFNRIAGGFRYELQLPPDPTFVGSDDPQVVQLRREAIEAVLADGDVQVLIDLLRRLHHDTAKRSVTQAIDDIVGSLYDIYRQTKKKDWQRLQVPKGLTKPQVADALERLGELAEKVEKRFAKALRPAREAVAAADWKAFLEKGLAPKIIADPVAPMFNTGRIPAEIIAEFKPLIEHARSQLLGRLAESTTATFELLWQYDEHFTRLRHARGILLYSDLPHKLAHELPATDDRFLDEVAYRLDATVHHLLLDEFQDTSFDQWRVLEPLAHHITSNRDGNYSFFCVGDMKQAIYGWRGGRAEIFDRLTAKLPLADDAVESMDQSWRSSQVVLDAVNDLFEHLADNPGWDADKPADRPAAAAWQGLFHRHEAQNKDLPGYVELITSPAAADDADASDGGDNGGDDDAAPPAGHLAFAAQHIAKLAAAAPGCSIGVLALRNQTLTELVYQLRKQHVDVSAEGAALVAGEPAVDVVLAALQLADHPGDTTAAFHVLNSPLAAIIGLRRCDDPAHRAAVSLGIRRAVADEGIAAVVARWARQLAESCDARGALKLTQLVELADRFEPTGSPPMRDFIEYIQGASIEEPATAQVRVMTVHKAKGLEFDIVVLPELNKKIGEVRSDSVYVDRDQDTDEVRAVYRATDKETRALSRQVQAAYQQERDRRLRDDLCSLYVAMTRPKHALHMILQPLKQKKNGSAGKAGNGDQSFAALLRGRFGGESGEAEHFDGGQTLMRRGDERWFAGLRKKAPARQVGAPAAEAAPPLRQGDPARRAATAARRALHEVVPSRLKGERRLNVDDLLSLDADLPRLRGTLIHALFSRIEWLDDAAFIHDDAACERITAEACEPASAPGGAWAKEQVAAFRAMLNQPAVRAALARPSLGGNESIEVWRERDFAVRLGDELIRGVFDRVVITRRGGAIKSAELLDYKTDRVSASDDPAKLADRYRPQLEAYRRALAAMLSIKASQVRAAVLYVDAGVRCDL
jgi:ATP-dependent exoDNAse (exonuclease V) beta subunit